MGVALHVGSRAFEVGSASFLRSFFSTVYLRLEDGAWGSRFPTVMTNLYAGEVGPEFAADALEELRVIKAELTKLPPEQVVWDHEHLDQSPPWGADIAPSIRTLADYFVTSAGQPLLGVLADALSHAVQVKLRLRVS